MIFEMRTYTLAPGKTGDYWQQYADGGFATQDPDLTRHLVGYFQSEFGGLNEIVHLWQFADLDERARIRRANYARPDWDAHLGRIRPMMVRQETKILTPSPVPGMCPIAAH